MVDHIGADVSALPTSRRWVFWVSVGLWCFAGWQLFLLPPVTTAFKSFGIEAPKSAALMTRIPPWLPLAVGVPLSLAVAMLGTRPFRTGVLALALLAALGAQWAHAALEIKLFQVSRMPPLAGAKP